MKKTLLISLCLLMFAGLSAQTKYYVKHNGKHLSLNGKIIEKNLDADAEKYIIAVENAGYTMELYEVLNINETIKKLKRDTAWTALQAWYPLMGRTAATCAINARDTATFRINWVNTLPANFDSLGWQANGTAYGKTGYIPSTHLASINSSHLSLYSFSDVIDLVADLGSRTDVGQVWAMFVRNPTSFYPSYSLAAGQRIEVAETTTLGHFTLNRTSSTFVGAYKENNLVGSRADLIGTLPVVDIWVGAYNFTTPAPSAKKYGYFSIGSGMTTAQRTAFYNAMVTFILKK